MLMKKLTSLLAAACMLTSVAATSVSAADTTESPLCPSWVDSSSTKGWGNNLPEYSFAPADITNWGGLTVRAAKGKNGNCLRLIANGLGNWIFLGHNGYPSNVFTVGTEYVASFDYLRGPYEYYWPKIDLKIGAGGGSTDHVLSTFEGSDWKEWTTHTWEFTAQAATSPTLTFNNSHGDIYIDNFIIKEKATGKVVFEHNFDMMPTSQSNWGYNPKKYAETSVAAFCNWPVNDYIGVVEHGDGYAAYIRNSSGENVFWNSSALNEKMRAAVTDETASYTLSYDYIACDGNGWPNLHLATAIDWDESWSGITTDSDKGTWQTYTKTVTGAQIKSGHFGWKFLDGCKVCVDNLKLTDASGNVIAEEKFDLVPIWNGPNELKVGEITLSQANGEAKAEVSVTNTYNVTKKVSLVTAVYDGTELVDVDVTTSDVAGDPTETNATTKLSHEISTTGLTGKTFSAFLWDSLSGMKALTDAKSITIE